MNNKPLFAWIIIIMVSLLPVFLWYFLGPVTNHALNYKDLTHSLGQITGLIGMTLFALTFLLTTRIKLIEDFFGGLDKVYISHSFLGGLAFLFIIMHPIFLVLGFVFSNPGLAAKYLLPSLNWPVNFGIIALLGMIVLLYITFYSRIKYNTWKFYHKIFGIFFILAVIHIFLIQPSREYIFQGYYIYAATVSIIGISGFFYSLFLKGKLNTAFYKIKKIISYDKDKNINQIILEPINKPIKFKSGQFVFLKFYNEKLGKEAHPYSIISKSNSPYLSVVIKNLGDYTSKISYLNIGDKVLVEGPYGRFNYYKKNNAHQIWIAGGIGVTPFLGIAGDLTNEKNMIRKVDMYYTAKNKKDFIGLDFFKEIMKKTNGKFTIIPWLSSEKGRLTIHDIYSKSGKLNNKEFYMCGPTQLKEAITKALIKSGVSKNKIFTEEFEFKKG